MLEFYVLSKLKDSTAIPDQYIPQSGQIFNQLIIKYLTNHQLARGQYFMFWSISSYHYLK